MCHYLALGDFFFQLEFSNISHAGVIIILFTEPIFKVKGISCATLESRSIFGYPFIFLILILSQSCIAIIYLFECMQFLLIDDCKL